jgi:hypothetical protein
MGIDDHANSSPLFPSSPKELSVFAAFLTMNEIRFTEKRSSFDAAF